MIQATRAKVIILMTRRADQLACFVVSRVCLPMTPPRTQTPICKPSTPRPSARFIRGDAARALSIGAAIPAGASHTMSNRKRNTADPIPTRTMLQIPPSAECLPNTNPAVNIATSRPSRDIPVKRRVSACGPTRNACDASPPNTNAPTRTTAI